MTTKKRLAKNERKKARVKELKRLKASVKRARELFMYCLDNYIK